MANTLTSANSVLTLTAAPLYTVPVHLQGFATDDAFTAGEVEMVETKMGVDGYLSGGFTPYPVPFEFTLQATSASQAIMDVIADYQDQQQEVLVFGASVMIPSLGMTYVLTNGFFVKAPPLPTAKKVMQERKFSFIFNRVLRVPI